MDLIDTEDMPFLQLGKEFLWEKVKLECGIPEIVRAINELDRRLRKVEEKFGIAKKSKKGKKCRPKQGQVDESFEIISKRPVDEDEDKEDTEAEL